MNQFPPLTPETIEAQLNYERRFIDPAILDRPIEAEPTFETPGWLCALAWMVGMPGLFAFLTWLSGF